jgi:hypothetical protein
MARIITSQTWNEQMKTNDASLSRQLMLKPDQISPVLTYLMGSEDNRFPLHYLSEGMKSTIEIEGDEFEYDVVGRLFKAVPLAAAVTTPNAGVGYGEFVIKFTEGIFPEKYTIMSPRNTQLVILKRKQVGTIWEYTVRLAGAKSAAQFVPASELQAGALYSLGWYAAASWGSRGSESTTTGTQKVRGDVSTIRKSYKWEGNVKHRTAKGIALKTKSGGEKQLWWPYEEWQHNLSFRRECESNFWYSQSNRDQYGQINEVDDEGNPIFRGAGLLEQIINKDTYSELTAEKIKQSIRDTFFGMSDAQNKQITLFTGTGGRDAFDTAMKAELLGAGYIKLTDRHFVSGSGRNLQLGGYFDTYQHVDGYTVNVVTNRLYDDGPLSKGLFHPKTGLPLESYRMTFVDTSVYDGQSNLVMINKKGRSMVRAMVKGMNEVSSNLQGNDLVATDKDASSLHMLKTGQVVLRRFNTSIDLQCIAGL